MMGVGRLNFSSRVRMIHKKTGPSRFSNFMSLKPADSVPGPVVANDNEMCNVSCS